MPIVFIKRISLRIGIHRPKRGTLMKLGHLFFIFSLLLSLSNYCFATNESDVATVLLLRGKAKIQLVDGKENELTANQAIPVGAKIITNDKSFVRLIFIDKSTINVGPLSSIQIQAFPKNEAGIIKLIEGQIRAEVTKNYMEMEDHSKSKLYIHTKTSAMGIRGTDFQVNYNPANQNSSLIVFEGKVAMGHIDRSIQNEVFIQNHLESIVSNTTAVLVKQGQFSAVNLNISDRATVPTKLAPKQLDALKANTTGIDGDAANKKQFRDIVPPGIDTSAVINKPGIGIIKADIGDAKGFFNEQTHEYKPAAGAIIDLKTVNVVAPPPGSAFDHVTKTFVISETLGKVDEKSGQYKTPTGYELSNEGQFAVARTEKVNAVAEVKTIDTKKLNDPAIPAIPAISKKDYNIIPDTAQVMPPAPAVEAPVVKSPVIITPPVLAPPPEIKVPVVTAPPIPLPKTATNVNLPVINPPPIINGPDLGLPNSIKPKKKNLDLKEKR